MKIGIYPGSFDPFTKGHQNIITKAIPFFDEIHIVVANNSKKKYLLSLETRKSIIKAIYNWSRGYKNIKVVTWDGLLIDYCNESSIKGYVTIIRGLRAVSDFENEFLMYQTNKSLDKYKSIETVFFMADLEYMFFSSSMVREIYHSRGVDLLDKYVPRYSWEALKLLKTNENISN